MLLSIRSAVFFPCLCVDSHSFGGHRAEKYIYFLDDTNIINNLFQFLSTIAGLLSF